jgi:hypothetical protein
MRYYNEERTNQGKYCRGRTPLQTFLDGLKQYKRFVCEETVAEESVA